MKKTTILILLGFFACISMTKAQDTLIIQEHPDSLIVGICTMNGVIESSAAGFTGLGYANINDGTGIGMAWSFRVDTSGDYEVAWRYALGGSDTLSRNGKLLVNYEVADTVLFPHTAWGETSPTSWTYWEMTQTHTIHLDSGQYTISLSSITHKGLANLDYFRIIGPAKDSITPTVCVPAYTFNLGQSIAEAGVVSYDPVQDYYITGTEITVTVDTTYPGYFFHSWSGEESGTDSVFTFKISQNTHLTALFYPDGTPETDPDACGYATIQHNNGTPYLLLGGAMGDTVYAGTLDELETYLGDDAPRTVIFYTQIVGSSDEILVRSNKTLIGRNDAHLENIKLAIQNCRNVIVRNLTISKVFRSDCIEINGAQNIWIDHCEFYSDLDHLDDEDYYDGVIDIKNLSNWITLSNNYIHHHPKTILITSGDQGIQDSIQRITIHHNYLYNCNSRLPSIRFGKAHIFNNYYKNNSTAINTRMGACVRVEKNYFDGGGTAVMAEYSEYDGSAELIDNHFGTSSVTVDLTCTLNVPYDYSSCLGDVENVPANVLAQAGVDTSLKYVGIKPILTQQMDYQLSGFPNPAADNLTIAFVMPSGSNASIVFYDLVGNIIKRVDGLYSRGINSIEIGTSDLEPGVYLYRLETSGGSQTQRLIIQR
ncbi:MAG: T9SS type A sorting domain-containing protein [Bacteroidales bacterium]|nr:T9SS type A sorting domain-containing protein [Bacteroidales bacterium]